MKNTLTLLDEKARAAIRRGVLAIYDPVRRTLGPQGRNALIYRTYNRGPRITNDGVTVSEVIEPKDPFTKLASGAFKEMCKRTNEKAGDGTTTTAVVGGKLFEIGAQKIAEGASSFTTKRTTGVMSVRKQILDEAETVKTAIKAAAIPVKTLEELEKIATVSVENAELGKIIAGMAWEVGVEGFIDTVEGYKGEVETELIKGMRFPAKVAAKAFVNNPARYEMVARDCHVLITNYALDNAAQLSEPLQTLNRATSKLIIFAPSFSDNTLVNMVSATKSGYFIFPVAIPALRTEQLQDLAVYCGANFVDKNTGKKISNVTANDLGFLEKLIVKDSEAKEDAIATGGKGTQDVGGKSAIQDRIDTLKAQMEETREPQFKKMIERRIASMASAVGVIRVSSSTQADSLYTKLKIEDAVYACKAGLRGGFVKGGGLCLKEIAETLPEDSILKDALLAPYEQIRENAGGDVEITDDIIDPAEAVYCAVDHATSVIANLLTVEILIPEEPDYVQGDGENNIAKAIFEYVITERRRHGIMKESEEEAAREQFASIDQLQTNDNG